MALFPADPIALYSPRPREGIWPVSLSSYVFVWVDPDGSLLTVNAGQQLTSLKPSDCGNRPGKFSAHDTILFDEIGSSHCETNTAILTPDSPHVVSDAEKMIDSSFKLLRSDSPLQYLAWGEAEFSALPRQGGWNYLIIETGAMEVALGSVREKIGGPALLLIGPECRDSCRVESSECVKNLAWVWAQPAYPTLNRLGRDSYMHFALAAEDLLELRQLHIASRNEIHRGDLHTGAALSGLQFLLEARIARIIEHGSTDRSNELVERALEWIQTHVATRQPLTGLADFLGVSQATVQRLFRRRLGTTVTKSIAETRLREAEKMLVNDRASIKEVAYRLGYRHPHDFSRAFRKNTGKLPSRWGTTPGRVETKSRNGQDRCAPLLVAHSS